MHAASAVRIGVEIVAISFCTFNTLSSFQPVKVFIQAVEEEGLVCATGDLTFHGAPEQQIETSPCGLGEDEVEMDWTFEIRSTRH